MTPDSANLYSGTGNVRFDRFDSQGNHTGLRHLGNTPTFELTPTVDTLEKKSAMTGSRATYKKIITGTKAEISLKLDEFDPENLALALLGKSLLASQAAEAAVVDRDIAGGADLIGDVYYDLGGRGATITAVKQGILTVDEEAYTVDPDSGYIVFHSAYEGTSPFIPGPASWSGSLPMIAGKTYVDGLAVGAITGHLQFISSVDQVSGPRLMVDVWNMDVVPDGAIAFLNEEFGQFTLKGQAMADTSRALGDQFFRVTYL